MAMVRFSERGIIVGSNRAYVAGGSELLARTQPTADHSNVAEWKAIRDAKGAANANDLVAYKRVNAFENRFGVRSHITRTEDIAATYCKPS